VTRRLLASILGLATLALALPTAALAGERLDRILRSGELRVGLSGDQPPLNMKNKKGEIVGLEVDLVRALADSMGLGVKLVQMPFAELLGAIEMGDVDLVISGMTITPTRNARVAFVGPYFISGKSLLTKDPALAKADGSDALDGAKRRYAALAGSTSAEFVRRQAPKATLVATPDYDAAVKMVIEGKVDALVADFPICEVSLLRHPDADLVTATTPFTVEPLGIALPAGDPLLVNLVNNYLTTLDETGTLTVLKVRWFSYGSWVDELP
jgi:polar amino acid transport system substrate-binding protein